MPKTGRQKELPAKRVQRLLEEAEAKRKNAESEAYEKLREGEGDCLSDEELEKIYVEEVDEEDEEEEYKKNAASSTTSGKPRRKFPTNVDQLPPAHQTKFYNERTQEQNQQNAQLLKDLFGYRLCDASCHYEGVRNTRLDISDDMFLRVQGTLPQAFFDNLLSVDVRDLTPELIEQLMSALPRGWVIVLDDKVRQSFSRDAP